MIQTTITNNLVTCQYYSDVVRVLAFFFNVFVIYRGKIMRFNNKDVVVAFVIDYSIPRAHPGRFVVYEIQGTFSGWPPPVDVKNDPYKIVAFWLNEFKNMFSNSFLLDLPMILNDNKVAQRCLLSSNQLSINYNPQFLIGNRLSSNDYHIVDRQRIHNFIIQYGKVVFKSYGAGGEGNQFIVHTNQKSIINDTINKYFSEKQFTLEEVLTNKYNHERIGHYRSIVFYNTENQMTRFFDIYKMTTPNNIIDSHNESYRSIRNYLNCLDLNTAMKRQQIKSFKYPNYRNKNLYFSNISKVIFKYLVDYGKYILMNEGYLEIGSAFEEKEKRLQRFIVEFHGGNEKDFFSFFDHIRPWNRSMFKSFFPNKRNYLSEKDYYNTSSFMFPRL